MKKVLVEWLKEKMKVIFDDICFIKKGTGTPYISVNSKYSDLLSKAIVSKKLPQFFTLFGRLLFYWLLERFQLLYQSHFWKSYDYMDKSIKEFILEVLNEW